MKTTFLQWHLGLGDAIVCNGLVRELIKHTDIIVPCYDWNKVSLKTMFSDVSEQVSVVRYSDPNQSDFFESELGSKSIKLGDYSLDTFDRTKWDQELYRHAGIDFECRWSSFKIGVKKDYFLIPPEYGEKYCLVISNGLIDEAKVERLKKIYLKQISNNIFDWINIIEKATEIHTIDCGALNLVNSLDLDCKKVLHKYARKEYINNPSLRGNWIILQ